MVPSHYDPQADRLVTSIHGSTERLLRLVNRILDVSRLRVTGYGTACTR